MSLRIAFFAVLAVALVGMVLGLDWQSASVSPPAPVSRSPPPVAFPAPPPAATDPNPAESSNAPVLPNGGPETPTPRAQAAPEETAPPGCNVEACEDAYRSFRKADCTFQPSRGERRRCTKR